MADDDELQNALDELLDAGSRMPPGAKHKLLGWDGDEVVEALTDIVCDPELVREDARGDGYAPIHAVAILVEREEHDAIEPLAERLLTIDPSAILQDHIVRGLGEFGRPALDAILDVYDEALESGDRNAMISLVDAGFETDVATDRLDEAMVTLGRYEPEFLGLLLPDYDRADQVVDGLEELADEFAEADPEDRPHDETLRGLCATIEDFGGQAPGELRD
jgi:hypothetical protein